MLEHSKRQTNSYLLTKVSMLSGMTWNEFDVDKRLKNDDTLLQKKSFNFPVAFGA